MAETNSNQLTVSYTPLHKEDAVAAMNKAAETLFQMETLLRTIAKEKGATNDTIKLCEMGAYIAFDIGNYVDCQRENLEFGGFKQ